MGGACSRLTGASLPRIEGYSGMSVSLCMLLASRVKRGVVRLRPDGFGCIHGVANAGHSGYQASRGYGRG